MKPVFVYGTLKQDVPDVPVEKRRHIVNATLDGFKMEGHDGFPGVKPGETKDVVVGELIDYADEEILNRLDRIEGYNPNAKQHTFYDRRLVMVETPDGEKIEAFVYIYMGNGMLSGEDCARIQVTNDGKSTRYTWIGNVNAW